MAIEYEDQPKQTKGSIEYEPEVSRRFREPKAEEFLEVIKPEFLKGRTGAVVRGGVTGLAGGLGELEEFGAYTAPQALGFQKNAPSDFLGRKTIFPTVSEISNVLESAGWRKPEPQYGAYETAGEIGGGLTTAVPALTRMGRGIFGSDLVQGLLGRKTRRAQEELGAETGRISGLSAKELSEAASEEQRILARARAAREQQLGRVSEQPAQAATAGAKAEREAGGAIRELAGVRTAEEAGRFRPIPQTPSQVGDFVREQANTFVTNIKQARNARADQLFGEATGNAKAYESLGQFVDTKPVIAQLDNLISKGGTKDYVDSLVRLRDDITRTRNFEGLEVIRRKLGDAAFGAPEEGYKAIGQQFAGDMREAVTQAMRNYSDTIAGAKGAGPFGKYLDEYKRLSEPLRVYSTRVGRGILETEDVGGQYFAKTGEQIASQMFSSPENYKKFIDAVGGNKQVTEAAARRFFAGLLEGKTKVSDVEKVFRDYRAVLNEMPAVRSELSGRYLQRIQRAEAVSQAAPKVAKEAGEQAKSIEQQFASIDKQVAQRMGDIADAKTLFSDSFQALKSAKPTDILRTFDETVLPKIRAAESKAGRLLITPDNLNSLRSQIEATQRIAEQTQRNRIIAGLVATYLVGQNVTSRGGQIIGE